jgi:phosphate-selective porin OprO/OprP
MALIRHTGIAFDVPTRFAFLILPGVVFAGAASAQTQQGEAVPVPGNIASRWTWTYEDLRPTVTSPDGRFSMSIRARWQIDAAVFNQADDVQSVSATRDVQFKSLSSGAITRRAYFGVEGMAFGHFWYEYRMDFGGSRLGLTDPFINVARISYVGGNTNAGSGESEFRINAGLIKPILTYEDAVSSASLTFLERPAPVVAATAAFGGAIPRLGAELTYQHVDLVRDGDNFLISGGLTGGDPSSRNSSVPENVTTEGAQLIGRVAYRLALGRDAGIQFGGSGAQIVRLAGDAAQGTRTIALQDYPELRVDLHHLVSTGPIEATGGRFWSLEEIVNVGRFYLDGEYFRFHVDRDRACAGCVAAADPEFSGWYVQASLMLTDDRKLYQSNATNNGMATFNNPRVKRPFDAEGNWGAWELAVRYSDLDLDWRRGTPGAACAAGSGCVRGGEQKIWTVGLNWYLNNNVRMLFDYLMIDVDKLNAAGKQEGQKLSAFGMRLQLTD